MILVVALAAGATAAFAQKQGTEDKHDEGITFRPHWFMQVQGGIGHTLGENDFGSMVSPAVALNAGYRFTPVWGLRFGLDGWQGKGSWVAPRQDYKFNFVQLNAEATVDLGNLAAGFNHKRFFEHIFAHREDLADENVDVMSVLFVHEPKLLGKEHLTVLSKLLNLRTQKMLILYSYYVKSFSSMHNPWPLLDDLLNYVKMINEKKCGSYYLSLFTYLLSHFSVYAQERTLHLKAVYHFFLTSKDPNSVRAAYFGIAQFYPQGENLDFLRVARHIKDPAINDAVICFLRRCPKIFPNNEMIDNLFSQVKARPQAWYVFYNLADSVRGATFLLKNSGKWMTKCISYPKEVAKIFFTLFKSKTNRAQCAELSDFPLLLKSMLDTHQEKMHSFVTKCVRLCPHSEALVKRLESSGVLSRYIEETTKGKTDKYHKRALALFDCLSRVAFAPSFLLYTSQLNNFLANEKLVTDAITVAVSMSNYKQCAAQFKQNGIVEYFQKLKSVPQYTKAASVFLTNIEKA